MTLLSSFISAYLCSLMILQSAHTTLQNTCKNRRCVFHINEGQIALWDNHVLYKFYADILFNKKNVIRYDLMRLDAISYIGPSWMCVSHIIYELNHIMITTYSCIANTVLCEI